MSREKRHQAFEDLVAKRTKGNCMCKGLKVGKSLVCSRNRNEVSEARQRDRRSTVLPLRIKATQAVISSQNLGATEEYCCVLLY